MYCNYERQLSLYSSSSLCCASYKSEGVGLHLISCERQVCPIPGKTAHLVVVRPKRHNEQRHSDMLVFVHRFMDFLPRYTRQSARSVKCILSRYHLHSTYSFLKSSLTSAYLLSRLCICNINPPQHVQLFKLPAQPHDLCRLMLSTFSSEITSNIQTFVDIVRIGSLTYMD